MKNRFFNPKRAGNASRPKLPLTATKDEEYIQNEVCQYLRRFHPQVYYHVDLAGIRVTSKYQRLIISRQQGPEGFPDIVIYERRGRYNGLVLEMKRESPFKKRDGQLKSDEHLQAQDRWLKQFRSLDFDSDFYWSAESAIEKIAKYLSTPFICP